MKIVVIALFLAIGLSAALSANAQTPFQIIQKDGKFIFTDGSSYYLFKKDGSFRSSPLGISGREITGKWKLKDELFVIQGHWGWINGGSRKDDYRQMMLYVDNPVLTETDKNLIFDDGDSKVKIYKCYFEIEELQKISGLSKDFQ